MDARFSPPVEGRDGWQQGFMAAMRQFMERRGTPVEINPDAQYDWDEVSVYGWMHTEAFHHVNPLEGDGCSWRLADDATLATRTYGVFTDTFHDNESEVGMNMAPAVCACGRYTGMTLRYVGTFGEVLPQLLGIEE